MTEMEKNLKNLGFKINQNSEKEPESEPKEKTLLEKAQAGELLDEDELLSLGFKLTHHGCGLYYYKKGDVEITFYASEICSIEINGVDIEKLENFHIPPATSNDNELCYRLGREALQFTYRMAGII